MQECVTAREWGRPLTPDLARPIFSARGWPSLCVSFHPESHDFYPVFASSSHSWAHLVGAGDRLGRTQSVTGQGQPGASWGLPAPALPSASWLLVGSETGLGEGSLQRSLRFQALFEVRLCPPDLMSRCWLLGGFWEQVAHWLAVESVFCPLTLTGLVTGPWKCC